MIRVVEPGIRPCRLFRGHLRLGIRPQDVAGIGGGGRCVAIKQEGTIHLPPVLACRDEGGGTAEMIAAEMHEDVALGGGEILEGGAVVEIIMPAEHEPDTLLCDVAGVPPGADLGIAGGVGVFAIVFPGHHAGVELHDLSDR